MCTFRTLWMGIITRWLAIQRCRSTSAQASDFASEENSRSERQKGKREGKKAGKQAGAPVRARFGRRVRILIPTLADFLWRPRQGHARSYLRAKIFGASHEKLFNFHFFQRLLSPEQVRDQGDLREVLDGFHFHVRVLERVPVSYDAVV